MSDSETGHATRACFDNDKYLLAQTHEILGRMLLAPTSGSVYVEFGGKAHDDQHAARVLPGYDPHLKIRLLKSLSEQFEVVVVVSARDILRPRIRGDSQLFYDRETIRLIKNLSDAAVTVNHGVLSMVREDYENLDKDTLGHFIEMARTELGISFIEHGFITGYPGPHIFDNLPVFSRNPKIPSVRKNILVLSPGGGSGKFGVCLSQLFHDFRAGRNSSYMKFETFPVFGLDPNHPLNLAFLAATADLGNTLVEESVGGLTSYDKDMENFVLLRVLIDRFCPNQYENPLAGYQLPSDMSVNRLTAGFADEKCIENAAIQEIRRRILRYRGEIEKRIETIETMMHLELILPRALQYLLD
ncbi:MAG: DUF1846 domain-containing protein [Minisyncoccia bacterium]